MPSSDDLYKEADQLKNSGQPEAAIAKLEELLQGDPNHVLSHLALAVLYGRVKRHEEAVKSAERACQIDPSDAFHFTALSVTYQRAFAGTQKREYIQMAEDAMARAHQLQGR